MSDKEDFVYCLGIGPLHTPCHLREQCWRFKALKRARFHVPIQQKWHFCEVGKDAEKPHYWPIPVIATGHEEGEEIV